MEIKITPPDLDYEFICHYDNGEKLLQNANTKNEHHFGDIDKEKLERFELVGNGKSYSVNMRTGEFDLNGVKVFFDDLPQDGEYKLIYFRRVRQMINSDESSVKYCFGLQCNYEGKNYQVLVWINEDDSLSIGDKK